MPTFLDVHTVEGGVSADDAAKANQADLATQENDGVKYLRYGEHVIGGCSWLSK